MGEVGKGPSTSAHDTDPHPLPVMVHYIINLCGTDSAQKIAEGCGKGGTGNHPVRPRVGYPHLFSCDHLQHKRNPIRTFKGI